MIGAWFVNFCICLFKLISENNDSKKVSAQNSNSNTNPIVIDEEDCLDKLLENDEYPDSVFHQVFSDPESSDSSEYDSV